MALPRHAAVILGVGLACLMPTAIASPTRITMKDFLRLRCGLDGLDAILTWRGKMYSKVPQEKAKLMFGLVGMNIAHCFQDSHGNWYFSSRELMYYTDPKDLDSPLREWTNPWTNETVHVMHVANSPVQGGWGPLTTPMDAELLAESSIVAQSSEINLFYPNVLAGNATFKEYSPQKMYEAGEYFKYFINEADLKTNTPSIPKAWFSWDRFSQWLPWMRMGSRPGGTFASTTGTRVRSLRELPAFIQKEIEERLPLYVQAPPCFLATPDSTSWTYFRDHFEDYLAGAQFPVPAPKVSVPCKWKPVPPQSPDTWQVV